MLVLCHCIMSLYCHCFIKLPICIVILLYCCFLHCCINTCWIVVFLCCIIVLLHCCVDSTMFSIFVASCIVVLLLPASLLVAFALSCNCILESCAAHVLLCILLSHSWIMSQLNTIQKIQLHLYTNTTKQIQFYIILKSLSTSKLYYRTSNIFCL